MKTRNSFVSNSSSTSFIVAWDKPVKSLPDVMKFIENKTYAKRILSQMKKQDAIILCTPPKIECGKCNYRFGCFTHRGQQQVIVALKERYGYEEEDCFGEPFTSNLIAFTEQNEGRVAYFLRFADAGEDGDEIGSEMRQEAEHILRTVPFEDIT